MSDEGNFELGKAGWYTAQNVVENEFLNEKLENTDYGIWYSVKFTGDANTHLWQTKTPPTEGEKYWGWIDKTKSGKTTKFKWDKKNAPTGNQSSSTTSKKQDAFLKDISNTPIQIYNGSLNYAKEAGLNLITDKADRRAYLEYVKDITDEMLDWIDKIRNGEKPDEVITDVPDKITLDDLE